MKKDYKPVFDKLPENKVEILPKDASIITISTSVVSNSLGGLGVLIHGLGSNDKVYQYNGSLVQWELQR